ncbi:MAG: HEAT repeat domain-containing protein [Gemmataceae bacterium]
MRYALHLLLFSAVLSVNVLGVAAQPGEKVDSATITKLIEQLGADAFVERQRASDELERMGGPALEELRKAARGSDPEVRRRAADLVGKIELAQEGNKLGDPTLIRVRYDRVPLKEAVADFAGKSGLVLVLQDPGEKLKERTVTLDLEKPTPVWLALEKFCQSAGLKEQIAIPEQTSGGGNSNREKGAASQRGRGGRGMVADDVPLAPAKPQEKKEEKPKEKSPEAGLSRSSRSTGTFVVAFQKEEAAPGDEKSPPTIAQTPPKAIPKTNVLSPLAIVLVAGSDNRSSDTSRSVRVRPAFREQFPFKTPEKMIGVPVEITPEPRIGWQQLLSLRVDRAIDDKEQTLSESRPSGGDARTGGEPIVVVQPSRGLVVQGTGESRWAVPISPVGPHFVTEIRLSRGEKESQSLVSLEGSLVGQVLGDREQLVEVDKVMQAEGKSIKGKRGAEIQVQKVVKLDTGFILIEFTLAQPHGYIPALIEIEPTKPSLESSPGAAPLTPRGGLSLQPFWLGSMLTRAPEIRSSMSGGGSAARTGGIGGSANTGSPWGLQFLDEKGVPIAGLIHPNWNKLGRLPGPGSLAPYIATYRPAKNLPPEPSRMVFVARRQAEVTIPFKLKNLPLK